MAKDEVKEPETDIVDIRRNDVSELGLEDNDGDIDHHKSKSDEINDTEDADHLKIKQKLTTYS